MQFSLLRASVSVAVLIICASVTAEEMKWSGVITGQGTDIGQLLFDQWVLSYAKVNRQTSVSFAGSTSRSPNTKAPVQALIDGDLDFANSEQPVSPQQQVGTSDDLYQFPLAAVGLVFNYNLPYGGMMDKNNQSAQLILDGYTSMLIWSKNITRWRDPRLLAIQTPEVRTLLPNSNIILVARLDNCSATNFVQSALRNFSNSNFTFPFTPSRGWSDAYRADSRVLSIAENTAAAALVTYKKNALGYIALSASTKNVRYAAMINANGELVRTANLTSVLSDPSTIQSIHPSTKYVSTALTNSRVPGAWPMGGYTYAMMRAQNTSFSCERRREMLLFFNWILGSKFEQRRMSVYGFQSLGDPILQNVLADLRSTPRCFTNASDSPIDWEERSQHEPASNTQAVLGANIAMLILTVVLFAIYISDNFKGVAASARVFQVVLFTGGILNYVSVFYFYEVPRDDSVCQARLWLASLGFTLIFSSLACRGYQILAVSQLTKKINQRVPHMVIVGAGNALLAGIQIIILLAWNQVDPFKSRLTNIDEFRRTTEYICACDNPSLWWGIEIAYAIGLLSFCLAVAYLTWDLKHMVQESKWMSISIYNAVVVLGISLALHMSSVNSDDSVFWVTGTVLFLLNTSVMLAMFGPKVYNRLRNIRDPENSSGSDQSALSHMHGQASPKAGEPSQVSTLRSHHSSKMGPSSSVVPTSSKMGPRSQSAAQSPRTRAATAVPLFEVNAKVESTTETGSPRQDRSSVYSKPSGDGDWASPVPNATTTPRDPSLPVHCEPVSISVRVTELRCSPEPNSPTVASDREMISFAEPASPSSPL